MATAEITELPVDVESNSLIEAMRKRRKQIASDKTVMLEVPGYSGQLLVKYRHLSFVEIKKTVERVRKEVARKNENAHLEGAADNLAIAAEEVFWKPTKDAEPVSLAESLEYDTPVKYDVRLAEILDIRGANGEVVETARECVFGVFNNDIALMAHHTQLTEWLSGSNLEVDEELAGESEPTAL